MFLGVVGFAMIVIIVAALIRSKSNPVPLFVIVPVSAALICGFTPVLVRPGPRQFCSFSPSFTSP